MEKILKRLNNEETEHLIEVSTHATLNTKFRSESLTEFWCAVEKEYQAISRNTFCVFITFAPFFCECAFSAVAVIKSKYIRSAISQIMPTYDKLIKDKQTHSFVFHIFSLHGIVISKQLFKGT